MDFFGWILNDLLFLSRKHTYKKYSCFLIRNIILKRSLNPYFNLISEITDICLSEITVLIFCSWNNLREKCVVASSEFETHFQTREIWTNPRKSCISCSFTLDIFLLNFETIFFRQNMYMYLPSVLFFVFFLFGLFQ